MKTVLLLLALSVVAFGGPVRADAFDELFGDEILLEEDAAAVDHSEAFLTLDSLDVGGSLRASTEYRWLDAEPPGFEPLQGVMSGTVYADARPSRDYRLFAESRWETSLFEDRRQVGLEWREGFVDFHWQDRLFFRAGKQTVQWGVGYFFSPADVINIGRIDPREPEADREGPTALRIHYPRRRWDAHLYALFDRDEGRVQPSAAPRLSFVAGGSEIGVGGFYGAGRTPRAMATLSTSAAGAQIFAETMLSWGSDKRFLKRDPGSPLGLRTAERDDLFLHATVGGRFSYEDDERRFRISGAGQYLFNGEGYKDQSLFDDPMALGLLLASDSLSPSDLRQTGRHYGAVSLQWSEALGTSWTGSALWIGDLSAGSGQMTAAVSYGGFTNVTPSIRWTRFYGNGEALAPQPSAAVTAGLTFGPLRF